MEKVEFVSVRRDGFVGLSYSEKKLRLYYPEELYPEIETNKGVAYKFLMSLNEIGVESNDIDFLQNAELIKSMIWIIRDYINHGILIERIPHIKTNIPGRINWKKTITSSKKIYHNGSMVFLDFYKINNKVLIDQLYRAYEFSLSISSKLLGWLFDFQYFSENTFNTQKALYFLKKELSLTFKDKKTKLLRHLINIVSLSDKFVDNRNYFFGRNSYNQAYEKMLKKVFEKSTENYKAATYNPSGVWNLEGEFYSSSKLRPDFVLESNKDILIFDAKFYRIRGENNRITIANLPNTSDIEKQIIYGEYINDYKKKQTYNFFIFPTRNENLTFNFVGKAYLNHIVAKTHNSIYCYEIDLLHLLNCYFSYSYFDFSELESQIQSFK
jgi:hypothetical protein